MLTMSIPFLSPRTSHLKLSRITSIPRLLSGAEQQEWR